jgi:hypothetical protein
VHAFAFLQGVNDLKEVACLASAVRLRDDFDAATLRRLAKGSRDPDQLRRFLSLAEIYDGPQGR